MARQSKPQVVKVSGNRKEAVYVMSIDGREVGLLVKFRNTRTDSHPWKAYQGVGMGTKFLAAYYPADGGRAAALAAVLAADQTR